MSEEATAKKALQTRTPEDEQKRQQSSVTESESKQKRKVGVEIFPRSRCHPYPHSHSFFVGTRKNTETGRAHMQRRQQLHPNQPYISLPTHNGFPFLFISLIILPKGQDAFGSECSSSSSSDNAHPLPPLPPPTRSHATPTQI